MYTVVVETKGFVSGLVMANLASSPKWLNRAKWEGLKPKFWHLVSRSVTTFNEVTDRELYDLELKLGYVHGAKLKTFWVDNPATA